MERDLNSPFEDWSNNIHAVITFLQPFFDDWRSYASLVSALLGVGVLIMENQVLLRMRMGRWEILGYILCKSLLSSFSFSHSMWKRKKKLIPVVVLVHELFTHASKQKNNNGQEVISSSHANESFWNQLFITSIFLFYFAESPGTNTAATHDNNVWLFP